MPEKLELKLMPISGQAIDPIEIDEAGPVVIGRAPDCGYRLNDSAVSRHHTSIEFIHGRWRAKDLGSRNGTIINGIVLSEDQTHPIEEEDRVTIGPWTFRVVTPGRPASRTKTFDQTTATGTRVQTIAQAEYGSLERQRLSMLMESAKAMHNAEREEELADAVLQAVLTGTGMTRATLVRATESFDEVEVIGVRTAGHASPNFGRYPISASLLRAASAGQLAKLSDDPLLHEANSIATSQLTSAMCAPVWIGSRIAAYLYLDDQAGVAQFPKDAASYCDALSQMCGLAMASLQRSQLEEEKRSLEAQFGPAHDVQQRILPSEHGVVGPVKYSAVSRPGLMVAGDLVDVVALDDHRAAIYLGDVTGKGLGPAMLMATCQAQLSLLLKQGGTPDESLQQVNRYIHAHSVGTEFITLWLAVIDREQGRVWFVDAGHGYCVIRRADGRVDRVASEGCYPLGVSDEIPCEVESVDIGVGDRLILFSDGAVEQAAPDGSRYNVDMLLECLADSADPGADIEAMFKGLLDFAQSETLNDDVTIVSAELLDGASSDGGATDGIG